MNRLGRQKQAQIIASLIEGNSIRATARIAGVSKDTVLKRQVQADYAGAHYQDRTFHSLTCKRGRCDEVWGFCYAKQKNVPCEKQGKFGCSDVRTCTAIDADTKLIPSLTVGNQDAANARILIDDLASRLKSRIQLTKDGLKLYVEAVEGAFGCEIEYATLVKTYESSQWETRYSPAVWTSCEGKPVMGRPDPKHISTSFADRSNLSMRMGIRRFTRVANAFSKKVENRAAAVALYFMHYNFCRVHRTLRVTPAMEAGLADHVGTIEQILEKIGMPSN
jgi:hypothetical protein